MIPTRGTCCPLSRPFANDQKAAGYAEPLPRCGFRAGCEVLEARRRGLITVPSKETGGPSAEKRVTNARPKSMDAQAV